MKRTAKTYLRQMCTFAALMLMTVSLSTGLQAQTVDSIDIEIKVDTTNLIWFTMNQTLFQDSETKAYFLVETSQDGHKFLEVMNKRGEEFVGKSYYTSERHLYQNEGEIIVDKGVVVHPVKKTDTKPAPVADPASEKATNDDSNSPEKTNDTKPSDNDQPFQDLAGKVKGSVEKGKSVTKNLWKLFTNPQGLTKEQKAEKKTEKKAKAKAKKDLRKFYRTPEGRIQKAKEKAEKKAEKKAKRKGLKEEPAAIVATISRHNTQTQPEVTNEWEVSITKNNLQLGKKYFASSVGFSNGQNWDMVYVALGTTRRTYPQSGRTLNSYVEARVGIDTRKEPQGFKYMMGLYTESRINFKIPKVLKSLEAFESGYLKVPVELYSSHGRPRYQINGSLGLGLGLFVLPNVTLDFSLNSYLQWKRQPFRQPIDIETWDFGLTAIGWRQGVRSQLALIVFL